MNAKAREIAQKIKDNAFDPWTMNKEARQYMGAFDLDEAESIIAEALAEQDKEIARMREAAERVVMFSPSDGAANNYIYVEHAMLCRSLRGGECDCDMGEFMKAMDDLESALLPPAEKEVAR